MRTPTASTIRRSLVRLAFAGFLVLTAACGAQEPAAQPSPSPGEHMEDGDMTGEFAFGEPADASDADRVVELKALDTLRFEPDAVEVKVGETVTFRVTNAGQNPHDAVLGDAETQEEHEREMREMSPGMMHENKPNAVTTPPGETREVTWHFTKPGELELGCHQPAHYEAGMVARITVTE